MPLSSADSQDVLKKSRAKSSSSETMSLSSSNLSLEIMSAMVLFFLAMWWISRLKDLI